MKDYNREMLILRGGAEVGVTNCGRIIVYSEVMATGYLGPGPTNLQSFQAYKLASFENNHFEV